MSKDWENVMIEQPASSALSDEERWQQRRRERDLAEEIVSVFATRRVRSMPDAIRYLVREASMKLRSIVLDRRSLGHLLRDHDRDVKVEYLQRDLLRCAEQSTEYRYPRPRRHLASFTTSFCIIVSSSRNSTRW